MISADGHTVTQVVNASAKWWKVLQFYALALLVGMVAGLGAIVFRGLIALFHNLFFLGQLSVVYDANVHTAVCPWGPAVIFAPAVAAVVVVFLVKNFAPEAKGHGVPEVMEAVYYNRGIIRPVVAVIKSVASALSIGSGGSAGREGPMIQVGASFGSTLGQWISMPPWQRITLVAGGAGGGIAASFNTPVGGILFAVEIIMHELSVRTLVPVAISTVTATYISRLVFGDYPSFIIPQLALPAFRVTEPWVLLSYVALGIVMGGAATLFIKSLYAFEGFFDNRVRASYYVRHVGAMLLVGIMFYCMLRLFGYYYIEGVGYATVQDVLTGSLSVPLLLLLLFALKLIVTSLTLGSGASGGVFSPAFFMGATMGGAYGIMLKWAFPGLEIDPPAFAIAGMAGMVGASTGAAVAAIVMIFEMTRDYNVIIPMTITVVLAYGLRTILSPESIYTMKLVLRGRPIPQVLRASVSHLKLAKEVMSSHILALDAATTLEAFAKVVLEHSTDTHFLVRDDDRIRGIVGREAAVRVLDSHQAAKTVGQIADSRFVVLAENATLADVLAEIDAHGASAALVASHPKAPVVSDILGIITDHELAGVMIGSINIFRD